jgi:hypothetical protein
MEIRSSKPISVIHILIPVIVRLGIIYCKRLKLEKVVDSSLGAYSFYYDNNIFPPRNTSKVDFLGYFNNNTSNVFKK